jgi:hypothetical protein
MPLSGYGIPAGAVIQSITDGTDVVMSAPATVTIGAAYFNAVPPPLDLTGIHFRSQIRLSVADHNVLLDASTDNELMTNSGPSGMFGWLVPGAKTLTAFNMAIQATGLGYVNAVLDVIAFDPIAGSIVDLGPVNLTLNQRITQR